MNTPVAIVNNQPITRFELKNAMQEYALQLHDQTLEDLSEAEVSELKKTAMEKLILWELIFQGAQQKGVTVPEEQARQEMQEIAAQFSSEEDFHSALAESGVSAELVKKAVMRDLVLDQVIARMFEEAPEPSAEQIDEEYGKYLLRKRKPTKIRARHILIKVNPANDEDSKAAALKQIQKLQDAPEDFAELARKYSACPSSAEGGDLGWFEEGKMDPAFEDAAFSQEVGVVGDVVESSFGYHLIKVEERQEDTTLSLEEVTPRIRETLKEKAGIEQLREWAASLRAEAVITFYEE